MPESFSLTLFFFNYIYKIAFMATHKSFFTKIFSAEKKKTKKKNGTEQIQNEILREENTRQTSS